MFKNRRAVFLIFLLILIQIFMITGCGKTREIMENKIDSDTTEAVNQSDRNQKHEVEQDRQDEAGVTNTDDIVGQWSSTEVIGENVIELIITIGSDNHFSVFESIIGENSNQTTSPTQSITASANGDYSIEGDKITLNYQELIGGDQAITSEFISENLKDKSVTYTFSVSDHRLILINSDQQERVFQKSLTE